MPAFNASEMSALDGAIEYYKNRVLMTNQFTMTHDEALHLFVPRQYRETMKMAPTLAGMHQHFFNTMDWKSDNGEVRMWFIGDHAPLAPRKPTVQPDAPQEYLDRITSWIGWRLDVGTQFGRVRQVLHTLNATLGNRQKVQVRWAWPTIIALCRRAGLEDVASEIQTYRTPARTPIISAALRQALATTAQTIASAQLVPDDIERADTQVQINLNAQPWVTEAGLGSFVTL